MPLLADFGHYRNKPTFINKGLCIYSCFSEKSKRRTKTLANNNNPRWNQSFVYSPIRRAELRSRVLEVTVWDYDRFGANEFLGKFQEYYLYIGLVGLI